MLLSPHINIPDVREKLLYIEQTICDKATDNLNYHIDTHNIICI